MHAEDVFNEFLQGTDLTPEFLNWAAPLAEARYKSVVSAIKREGITQVLELASGLSLRGLAMTEDPEYTYVETDLPGITEEKQQILSIIKSNQALRERQNLFFHAVNILEFPQISSAIRHFEPSRPVAVIHEGLFQYLSMSGSVLYLLVYFCNRLTWLSANAINNRSTTPPFGDKPNFLLPYDSQSHASLTHNPILKH
jgi:O-methyltransferase involved in polyketide biosynthesis